MLGAASVLFLLLAPVFAWDIEIQNHSPLIKYEPYADGTTDGGWALWSSDIGFYPTEEGKQTVGGKTASGDTAHVSAATGASFSFTFRGTAIKLYGTANVSYTVFLDNTGHPSSLTPTPGLLFEQDGLDAIDHYLTLTLAAVHGNQQVFFEKAVITSASNETLRKNTFDSNNPNVTFSGTWKSTGIAETPLYRETAGSGNSVQMTFKNARAVAANANLNWGHWTYVVDFDGEKTTLNASTWWLVGDTFLFFKDGLDPSREYTINLSDAGQTFSFTSFSIWQPQSGSEGSDGSKTDGSETPQQPEGPPAAAGGKDPEVDGANTKAESPSLSRGAVAGIVVAAVAATALCLGLLIFALVKRRHRQQEGAHRIFPLVDEKAGGSPRSSAHGGPRMSPLMLEEAHTTPYPPPIEPEGYPHRPPGLGSDQLSVPPSVSTEGGLAAAGARRTNREKKRQLQNAQPARDRDASPTQSTFSGPPRSEGSASRDRETVERVLAMLVERIDTRPVHDGGAPPSYMSDTGPRHT